MASSRFSIQNATILPHSGPERKRPVAFRYLWLYNEPKKLQVWDVLLHSVKNIIDGTLGERVPVWQSDRGQVVVTVRLR